MSNMSYTIFWPPYVSVGDVWMCMACHQSTDEGVANVEHLDICAVKNFERFCHYEGGSLLIVELANVPKNTLGVALVAGPEDNPAPLQEPTGNAGMPKEKR